MNLATPDLAVYQLLPAGGSALAPGAAIDRILVVNADFVRAGAWTGVSELVELAYLDLRAAGQDALIDTHNYGLHMLLPDYRNVIPLKYASLTDTAQGSERTRNFAADRAYRIIHSMVGLVLAWKELSAPQSTWAIAVTALARAQNLAQRFFNELARRGNGDRGIAVLAVLAPDDLTVAGIDPVQAQSPISPSLAALTAAAGSTQELASVPTVVPVEARSMTDLQWEQAFPQIIAQHLADGNMLELARAALRTECMYNHYGYYHEARSLAQWVVPHLHQLGKNEEQHAIFVTSVVQSHIASNDPERALEILMEFAPVLLTQPLLLAKFHYTAAMLHLRFLDVKDIALSEHHLMAGLDCVEQARGTVSEHDCVFMGVFLNNGLAFVRMRQGRRHEAVALCLAGFALLTAAVGDDKHMLHRSVLLYNSAQVFLALGQMDDALKYFEESITMDPYYSEYHNEMGNVLQRQGKFDEALSAYALAIKYSAPYPEVYFNMAVSHCQLEEWEAALAALDFSAELNPHQPELYMLRAEVYESLGRNDDAVADYSTALATGSPSVTARVNRAILYYQAGQLEQALLDMHHAIEQDPQNASLYENRAEIYRAMVQPALVSADLDSATRFREAA